jgi:hypothetical protein
MASVAERVSVLETQVLNIDEKIDDIKEDVKQNHTDIKTQLTDMYNASCTQHSELAKKIGDIEKFKNKWMYMIIGGVAVLGYLAGHSGILKILS